MSDDFDEDSNDEQVVEKLSEPAHNMVGEVARPVPSVVPKSGNWFCARAAPRWVLDIQMSLRCIFKNCKPATTPYCLPCREPNRHEDTLLEVYTDKNMTGLLEDELKRLTQQLADVCESN